MRLFMIVLAAVLAMPSVAYAEKLWVTVDRLNRRTCPDTSCGIVGRLFFREGVDVFERRGSWVRISRYYNASCVNGHSEYVDSGNATCTAANGIESGEFAEWVYAKALSTKRPLDPAKGTSGTAALIRGSDDYQKYKGAFVKATEALLASGRCTKAHFKEMGGWVKSSTYGGSPIYFTYCGDYRKIYLNAETGQTFEK